MTFLKQNLGNFDALTPVLVAIDYLCRIKKNVGFYWGGKGGGIY